MSKKIEITNSYLAVSKKKRESDIVFLYNTKNVDKNVDKSILMYALKYIHRPFSKYFLFSI